MKSVTLRKPEALQACLQAWSQSLIKDKKALERVRKTFPRLFFPIQDKPYFERPKALNLFSLEIHRLRGDLIEAYTCITGIDHTTKLLFFLNVWIASSFSFKHHHSLAAKKGFGLLNMIKRTFPRISRDDVEQLYATYVQPLLEYASSVVHTGLQTDILCLERVQRTATRLVRGIRTYPYGERLLLLNLFLLAFVVFVATRS